MFPGSVVDVGLRILGLTRARRDSLIARQGEVSKAHHRYREKESAPASDIWRSGGAGRSPAGVVTVSMLPLLCTGGLALCSPSPVPDSALRRSTTLSLSLRTRSRSFLRPAALDLIFSICFQSIVFCAWILLRSSTSWASADSYDPPASASADSTVMVPAPELPPTAARVVLGDAWAMAGVLPFRVRVDVLARFELEPGVDVEKVRFAWGVVV